MKNIARHQYLPCRAAPASNHGLGFKDTHWDFSAVRIYGHPLLKDADGRVMGGQH